MTARSSDSGRVASRATKAIRFEVGNEYRYLICCGKQQYSRIDPYAREVTNSVGNSIVHDPHFDWGEDLYQLPSWPELVLYEMHIGTFNGPLGGGHGTYAMAVEKFDHLQRLGINVIEVMSTAEFAGDVSWGYNPRIASRWKVPTAAPKRSRSLSKRLIAQRSASY